MIVNRRVAFGQLCSPKACIKHSGNTPKAKFTPSASLERVTLSSSSSSSPLSNSKIGPRRSLSNGVKIAAVFRPQLELGETITHVLHIQILCGFQWRVPRTIGRSIRGTAMHDCKSPSCKIGLLCSPKACIKHSGNTPIEVDSLGIARTCDFFVVVVVAADVEFENRTEKFPESLHQEFGERAGRS